MENEEYFMKCWLTAKAKYPRLRKRMDEIEIEIGGLLPPRRITPRKDNDEKSDEKLGEVV